MSTIGGVASWLQQQPYAPPSFSQLDTNSDGSLSLDEFEAGAPKAASRSGTTQDGAPQSRAEALFNRIDSNGDGSVSTSELDDFRSRASQQQSAQQFMTQLIASGQSGAGGAGGAGAVHHHGGGHHHGGSMGAAGASGADSSDGGSTGDSLLSTLENLVDANAPTASGGTDGSATDAEGNPIAPDTLAAANSAYASGSNAADLWSGISNLLRDAA